MSTIHVENAISKYVIVLVDFMPRFLAAQNLKREKKKLGFLSCTNLILVPGASNPQHLKRPGSPGDEDGTNLITAKKQKTLLLCSMLHRLAINLLPGSSRPSKWRQA